MFGISVDDVQDCIGYDCQQKPDKIDCSLDFPARWNLTEFKNATFTFLDCNVLRQSQIPGSLEMEGCNSVCNVTVAVVANQLVSGSCPSTCPTYTYCIIAGVAMEPGKSVYLNSTARKLREKHESDPCITFICSFVLCVQVAIYRDCSKAMSMMCLYIKP